MIDLETLGLNAQAPITQVGVVMFNRDKIIESRNFVVDFEEAFKDGVPDASTVKWWIMQDKEAKELAMTGKAKPVNAAHDVASFISLHGPDHFWAHATFDFPIIQSWFDRLGISKAKSPIDFRKCIS